MIVFPDTIYSINKPNNATLNLELVGAYACLSMIENDFHIHFSESGIEIRLEYQMDVDDIDDLIHYLNEAKAKLIANRPKHD